MNKSLYTLSLHYALPISTTSEFPEQQSSLSPKYINPFGKIHEMPWRASLPGCQRLLQAEESSPLLLRRRVRLRDRKSTRLNSSHTVISYAVFCLKKKDSA